MTTPRPARRRVAQPTADASAESAADAGHATLWDAAPINAPALPDDAPRTIIRDSLYDTIPLGALELDLIGTPEFVRLQGIKQLGFCYRVWPGATHTRFEHSLGVYYLMLRGLRALWAQDYARERLRATETDLRTMLAAALLHDIGHYPFSHAIEELGYPVEPHERCGPPHHRTGRGGRCPRTSRTLARSVSPMSSIRRVTARCRRPTRC